jgi:hypothetical protein
MKTKLRFNGSAKLTCNPSLHQNLGMCRAEPPAIYLSIYLTNTPSSRFMVLPVDHPLAPPTSLLSLSLPLSLCVRSPPHLFPHHPHNPSIRTTHAPDSTRPDPTTFAESYILSILLAHFFASPSVSFKTLATSSWEFILGAITSLRQMLRVTSRPRR